MKRFTIAASSVGVLLVTSCLFLAGCSQSGSGDKMGMSDAKMSDAKMIDGKMSAMEKDHMMSDDKMARDKLAGK